MRISLPVYVEEDALEGDERLFVVRPLFFAEPLERADRLGRALSRLAVAVRRHLDDLGDGPDHSELAAWTRHPVLHEVRFDRTIELRGGRLAVRHLVVWFNHLDRRVGFFPAREGVWFAVERGQTVEDRAAEVLTDHLRALEKDDRLEPSEGAGLGRRSRAWLTALDVEVRTAGRLRASDGPVRLASLSGDGQVFDGRRELERVGRCLEWRYPDDLERVVGREAELADLDRLLLDPRRRPVLLVGPPGVGKTALLHERVFRQVAARPTPFQRHRNTWTVEPMRIISGMAYIGQWEARLLAILAEVRRRDHVLYTDDLLGMFAAGRTSRSDLSVAKVLKTHLERGRVRLLAEMTPEAYRILQEVDRGMADLFDHVVLRPPTEEEGLRTLVAIARRLEGRHRCRFSLDVLPGVVDLCRRHVRDVVFPGVAARILADLALRRRGEEVDIDHVLAAFRDRSGLSLTMLDDRETIDRAEVVAALGRRVVGQPEAVEAMADVVATAKARLADPSRPLATFLFVGPTGVGKTQSAKTLASHLFGSEDRLVRLDMNECVDDDAVVRLLGHLGRPEGRLTGPVRRQPFCVVLLDEIEKAAPAVFDVLLQVLGEGRLTDALGRTVDFGSAILILTSNLGVREAAAGVGFVEDRPDRAAVYRSEVERFFRPEFVNRIDRIVPFRNLSLADVQRIARVLLDEVLGREGLVRRKVVLEIDGEALDRVAALGFHPHLGARALKRSIERCVARPVGARLAGVRPGVGVRVVVLASGSSFAVRVDPLVEIEPVAPVAERIDLERPEAVADALRRVAARLRPALLALRPPGPVRADAVSAAGLRYFRLAGLLADLVEGLDEFERRLEEGRLPAGPGLGFSAAGRAGQAGRGMIPRARRGQALAEIISAEDVHRYLMDLLRAAPPPPAEVEERLVDLVGRAAVLETLAAARLDEAERALVVVAGRRAPADAIATLLAEVFRTSFDLAVLASTEDGVGTALVVEGPSAPDLARLAAGTYLHQAADGTMTAVAVRVEGGDRTASDWRVEGDAWRAALREGRAAIDDDPHPLGPVVQVGGRGATLDLATGQAVAGFPPSPAVVARWLVARLPLPPEVPAP